MKWWGLMDGWFTPETGFVVNEGDITNRHRYNLGDNIISDTELRIIGQANNPDRTFMFRGTSCFRPEVPEFWDMAAKVSHAHDKVVWWACGVGGKVPCEMPSGFYGALEANAYWGVRGKMSEQLLLSLGVPKERIFVTHCPTLLRGVLQGFKFEMKKPTDIKTVVVSTWTAEMPHWLDAMAERFSKDGAKVIIHLQDNEEAYKAVYQNTISERLKPMFDKYIVDMSRQPSDLDKLLKTADLCIGVKLHCNLPALAWGVPTYTFTDDWRMKEILMPQEFPCISAYKNHTFKGYSEKDFEHVESKVTACHEANRAFLQAAEINTQHPMFLPRAFGE